MRKSDRKFVVLFTCERTYEDWFFVFDMEGAEDLSFQSNSTS